MSRELCVTPEQRLLEYEIKAIYAESKQPAGARSIATIASERGFALSRYRATRLMKKLGLVSCQQPKHRLVWRCDVYLGR